MKHRTIPSFFIIFSILLFCFFSGILIHGCSKLPLEDQVKSIFDKERYDNITNLRKNQIGDGERCEKRRTYREKDNIVIDHITGKKASYKDIFRGRIELLS